MITGRAVSALHLHHHRRVFMRRAVNYDDAGALPGRLRLGHVVGGLSEVSRTRVTRVCGCVWLIPCRRLPAPGRSQR